MREFLPSPEGELPSLEDEQLEQRFGELSEAFELGGFKEAVRQVREGRAEYLDRGNTSEAYLTLHDDREVVVRLPRRDGPVYIHKTFQEAVIERTTALIIGEKIEDLEKPLAINIDQEVVCSEFMSGLCLPALTMEDATEISDSHFERAFIAIDEAVYLDLTFDVGTLSNVVVDEQRFGFLDYTCAPTSYLLDSSAHERAVVESKLLLSLLHSAGLKDVDQTEDPRSARDAWRECLLHGVAVYADYFPKETALVMQLTDFYRTSFANY